MATTRVAKTIDIYRHEGKDGVIVNKGPGEEASQTYKAGAPLSEEATSKELLEWPGTTNASLIVGMAVKDATGTTGADVPYYEANPYNLFAGTVINATSAIALAASHINLACSLIKSGNDWLVDIADTTTEKVYIIAPIDPIGDTNARVVFRFIGNEQQKVAVT